MSDERDLHIYREQQRVQMVYRSRRDHRGNPLCHYCGKKPGHQMHELINRAQTGDNPAALRASFNQVLCSWLDEECHNLARTREVERKLWERNIRVYGEEAVRAAFQEVVQILGFRPIVHFPEGFNG